MRSPEFRFSPSFLARKLFERVGIPLLDCLHLSAFPIPFWRKRALMRQYRLWNYHIEAFRGLYRTSTLRDKAVLEIGGSNLPPELLFQDFQASQWVSVDYLSWRGDEETPRDQYGTPILPLDKADAECLKHKHLTLSGSADAIPDCFGGHFDTVVSICAFEHIQNLAGVLERACHALKPGGTFYTHFGPIWSGPGGSHFWISGDFNYNNSLEHGVPYFAHLLQTPEELAASLAGRYDDELLERLKYWIYTSPRINHLFYEDYERLLRETPLVDVRFRSCSRPLNGRVQRALEAKYPGHHHFRESYVTITAKKP